MPFMTSHTWGVPGVPLSFVMANSLDFSIYKMLLKMSFFDYNHIRLFMGVIQPFIDPLEGSGWLALIQSSGKIYQNAVASSITSSLMAIVDDSHNTMRVCPVPPSLMQSGLGDAEVRTRLLLYNRLGPIMLKNRIFSLI